MIEMVTFLPRTLLLGERLIEFTNGTRLVIWTKYRTTMQSKASTFTTATTGLSALRKESRPASTGI